jgi:hypothetical protein
MNADLWIGVLLAAAALFLIYRSIVAARAFARYRGQRLVTCPENQQTVAIDVSAGKAAWEAFLGRHHVRLHDCTRWPEKAGCGQDCLSQVEANPALCMVWNIVHEWYAGKKCVYCGKPFAHIEWHDHRPALRSPAGKTVQWVDLRPETLPQVFETHQPVCWDCHIAETFRREHPDLVTDRLPH